MVLFELDELDFAQDFLQETASEQADPSEHSRHSLHSHEPDVDLQIRQEIAFVHEEISLPLLQLLQSHEVPELPDEPLEDGGQVHFDVTHLHVTHVAVLDLCDV